MAEDERLEIVITLDDKASEGLRTVAENVDKAAKAVDKLGGSQTRTNVKSLAFLSGIRSLNRGIGAITSSTTHYLGKNNMLAKGLTEVQYAISAISAPLMIYKGALAMFNIEGMKSITVSNGMAIAVSGLMTAVGALAATFGALTAKTSAQRSQMAAMAGVMWGLTAAQWAYNIAKAAEWSISSLGTLTPVVIAAVAGVVAGLSGFAAARYMAEGGIVTRPMHAVVGERGPEAVIPLARLPSLLGVREGRGRGSSISVAIYGNADRGTVDKLTRELEWHQRKDEMRKGRKVVRI